jgi:hypothetical protein
VASFACGVLTLALLFNGYAFERASFATGIVGIVLGALALASATRRPGYAGKGLATAGIAGSLSPVLLLGFALLYAVLNPRPNSSESATLGDIRTLMSAEAAYRQEAGGHYGTLECLAAPATCVSGYSGPTFLDSTLASGVSKSGYHRMFHPGPVVRGPASPPPPVRLERWAYTAVPVVPGQTGTRGFCGDSSGRICFTNDGSAPTVVNGACDPDCRELR